MNALLRRAARVVEGRPGQALAVLAVLTLVLGVFASQQSTDTDLTAFAPESELNAAFERVQEDFGGGGDGGGATVQVIVDAGEDGDVLSPAGVQAARRITEVVTGAEGVRAALAESTPQAPAVITYAAALEAAVQQQGGDLSQLPEEQVDALATQLLTGEQSAQAGGLLSQDLDAENAEARAGLVIVRLGDDLPADELAAAELAIDDALQATAFEGVEVSAFGQHILGDRLTEDMNSELPLLLSLSLLLIVGILFLTYRKFSDVAIGFVGLIVTIVWTFGVAVILGPDYAGITGPFSQIATVVPVLLVGLGIDYAIHITSRYREEQSHGNPPARAAHVAVYSVGGALVLATITTLVGFLTNVASPLPPIRDFGIFVAGGVLSAFVVMLVLVPSARSLLDRRAAAKGTLKVREAGDSNGLTALMARLAVVSEKHTVTTLVVAGVVTLAAAGAGSQITTTFSQDDFIPQDSEIGQLLDDLVTLFGGDVDERTYVLVEGELADPAVGNAMLQAQSDMADTDGVRSAGGRAQVSSPAAVVAGLAQQPEVGQQLQQLGFTGDGFAPDADMAAIYDLARQAAGPAMDAVLTADGDAGVLSIATSAGQEDARDLRDQLHEDLTPLADTGLDTTVVSEPLMLEHTLDELTDSQTRSIAITLGVSLLVLLLFFGIREKRPLLGAVTMIPSVLVVTWVLGSMWLFGISFNVLTAMVASLAIGIGVPFGIHITHRFTEDRLRTDSIDEAIRLTVTHTGGALAGSAATTAAGFGVLGFSSLVPLQQFGLITALTIVYSLVAAVLIEPAVLKLWAQWRERRDGELIGVENERIPEPV